LSLLLFHLTLRHLNPLYDLVLKSLMCFDRRQTRRKSFQGLMMSGSVMYLQYFMQVGPGISLLLVIAMFMGQAVFLASEWWLSLWSKANPAKQGDIT
jgi:hypothetical protein